MANDLHYNTFDSIIIWEKEIIHHCPFSILTRKEFAVDESVIYNKWNSLLFQITGSESHCGENFFTTQEGVYIHEEPKHKYQYKYLPVKTHKMDTKTLGDLIMANVDFNKFDQFKLSLEMREYTCKAFIANLFTIKNLENKFTRFYANNGDETIVYSKNNNIIIPTCAEVKNVTIQKRTSNCYEDLPATFVLNNQKIKGFITNSKIIVKYSKIINCNKEKKYYMFENKTTVIQQGNQAYLDHNIKRIALSNQIMKNNDLNFHHSELIIQGIDSISDFPATNEVKEFAGSYLVLPTAKNEDPKHGFRVSPAILMISSLIIIAGIIMATLKRQAIMVQVKRCLKREKENSEDYISPTTIQENLLTYAALSEKASEKPRLYQVLKAGEV